MANEYDIHYCWNAACSGCGIIISEYEWYMGDKGTVLCRDCYLSESKKLGLNDISGMGEDVIEAIGKSNKPTES